MSCDDAPVRDDLTKECYTMAISRKFAALPGLAVAALCLAGPSAHAACFASNLLPTAGMTLCDGCRYQGALSMDKNETCERPALSYGNMQFHGGRIIERAKHGVAGASGTIVAYQPAKNYVGPDEFVVEITGKKDDAPVKYTVRYVVTVK